MSKFRKLVGNSPLVMFHSDSNDQNDEFSDEYDEVSDDDIKQRHKVELKELLFNARKAIRDKKVARLASIEEKEVVVPEQYHKNFTSRGAELINKISSECGGVQISFPRPPKVFLKNSNVLDNSKFDLRKVKKSLILSRSRALVTVSIRQLQ